MENVRACQKIIIKCILNNKHALNLGIISKDIPWETLFYNHKWSQHLNLLFRDGAMITGGSVLSPIQYKTREVILSFPDCYNM